MKLFTAIAVLLIANVLASQKIILPGREPGAELIFEGKRLVFEENSSDVKKDEILELFEKYKTCVTNRDIKSLLDLFVDNDKFVISLSSEDSKKRWLEIAGRVKSYQVLGYMVDAKSEIPTDLLYLIEKEQTGRAVANMSVVRVDGLLKITSNSLKPDSPQFLLRDWWAKNYPAKPKIVYNSEPVSDIGYNNTRHTQRNGYWIVVGFTTLILCIAIILKFKKRR